MYFRKDNGITLIALIITVIVMMIISSTIIYNMNSDIKIEKINKLYNDIENLNIRIEDYYLKYGELPTLIKYGENKNDIKALLEHNANIKDKTLATMDNNVLNPNDSDEYYIIDVEKLEGLTLNYGYGDDYNKAKEIASDSSSEEYIKMEYRNLLPQEYQEVEYIGSTGTQFIYTGVIPDENIGFDIEFLSKNSIDTSSYGCILGARKSSKVNDFQLTTYSSNTTTYKGTLRFGTSKEIDAGLSANKKMRCVLKNNVYTNKNDLTTTIYNQFTSPVQMTLFALNNNGSIIQHGKIQLYKLKLYNKDLLLRDYIPCFRVSDKKIGLYDLANKEFCPDSGTGIQKFEKGNDSTTKVIDENYDNVDEVYVINKETHQIYYPKGIYSNDTMQYLYNIDTNDVIEEINKDTQNGQFSFDNSKDIINKNKFIIYGKSEQKDWTDEYQQVEYIESSGTQYIDTLVKPSSNIDFEITGQAVDKAFENGASDDWATNALQICFFGSSNKLRAIYANRGYYDYDLDVNAKFNKAKITGKGEFYINDNLVKSFENAEFIGNINLHLFASHYLSDGNNFVKTYGRIKNAKIYENNTLKRDFIPCYRKSDGVIGMYDVISREFFVNQGTGTFNKGSKVSDFNRPQILSVGDLITDKNDENYGKYKLPIKVRGKNLFDISQIEGTTEVINNENKSLTVSAYPGYCGKTLQQLCPDLKVGDKVIMSYTSGGYWGIYLYKAKSYIHTGIPCVITQTMLDSGVGFYNAAGTGNTPVDISNIMIQAGEFSDGYVPYVESITKNIYLKEPLRYLNSQYYDYIDILNKKVVRNVGEVLWDGSEQWTSNSTATTISTYSANLVTPMPENYRQYGKIKSNYLSQISTPSLSSEAANSGIFSGINLIAVINKKDLNLESNLATEAIAKWKEYLTSHNMHVLYATKSEYSFKEEVIPDIEFLEGVNFVSVETEITPSNIEFSYYEIDK